MFAWYTGGMYLYCNGQTQVDCQGAIPTYGQQYGHDRSQFTCYSCCLT